MQATTPIPPTWQAIQSAAAKTGMATPSLQEKALVEKIINQMKNHLLSKSMIDSLRMCGNMEANFQGCSVHAAYSSEVQIEELTQVNEYLFKYLKKRIRTEFNPKIVQISARCLYDCHVKHAYIKMVVSDCRKMIHLNHEGEVVHAIPVLNYHTHDEPSNDFCKTIREAEEIFGRKPIPQDRIRDIAADLFKKENIEKFQSLILEGKLDKVVVTIAFGHNTNPHEYNCLDVKAIKTQHLEIIDALSLGEVAALVSHIRDKHGLPMSPQCYFGSLVNGWFPYKYDSNFAVGLPDTLKEGMIRYVLYRKDQL